MYYLILIRYHAQYLLNQPIILFYKFMEILCVIVNRKDLAINYNLGSFVNGKEVWLSKISANSQTALLLNELEEGGYCNFVDGREELILNWARVNLLTSKVVFDQYHPVLINYSVKEVLEYLVLSGELNRGMYYNLVRNPNHQLFIKINTLLKDSGDELLNLEGFKS